MFLTEILLNPDHAQARRDLVSVYELHRTLSAGFPDGARPRLLFRQETTSTKVLLLSADPPEYEAGLRAGRLLSVRGKPFAPAVEAGCLLRFKLRANPTRKTPGGSRRALYDGSEQHGWLARKGSQHGFSPLNAHVVENRLLQTLRCDAPAMTHLAVDFHGTLEVIDSGLFGEALRGGIGSAKAFGFGMLCVAR